MRRTIILLLLALSAPAFLRAQAMPVPTAAPDTASPTATEVAAAATPVPTVVFTDTLNRADHAPFWVKLDFSYDYAVQGDLVNSVAPINNGSYSNPGGLGSYTGSATAGNNGLGLGFEIGLLLDPHNGIAFGAHFLQSDRFLASLNYNNANQDSEAVTLLPTVVPITLDYYLFLPDGGGRFFASVGAGYYIANVRVGQNTTTDNFFGSNNTIGGQDIWEGNVSSVAVGFQASLGREFAVSDRVGFTVFARGRYARISNFQGQLLDSNAVAGQFGLAEGAGGVVDVDAPSSINAANGERYAVIDFTGFEAGMALDFYGF